MPSGPLHAPTPQVMTNAGQANAATGKLGYEDSLACAKALAAALKVPEHDVMLQSTGRGGGAGAGDRGRGPEGVRACCHDGRQGTCAEGPGRWVKRSQVVGVEGLEGRGGNLRSSSCFLTSPSACTAGCSMCLYII